MSSHIAAALFSLVFAWFCLYCAIVATKTSYRVLQTFVAVAHLSIAAFHLVEWRFALPARSTKSAVSVSPPRDLTPQ